MKENRRKAAEREIGREREKGESEGWGGETGSGGRGQIGKRVLVQTFPTCPLGQKKTQDYL